jgi:biopolymer transport protein ExbD
MKRKQSSASVPEPDMTPMIDIVFQLLTFFMIAINFENTKADERVKLPKDVLAKPPESKPPHELVLNVGFDRATDGSKLSPDPVLFYSGSNVPLDRIKPELEMERNVFQRVHAGTKLSEVSVLIRADADVPTGLIQQLIKTCQDVGYEKFSLKATQDET